MYLVFILLFIHVYFCYCVSILYLYCNYSVLLEIVFIGYLLHILQSLSKSSQFTLSVHVF